MKASFYNMEMNIDEEPGLQMEMDMPKFDPFRTPYELYEEDFPHTGSQAEQMTFLIRYAVLAPSGHNTQPWKFAVSGEEIAVFADYTRRLPVADPDNRELQMSIGAAVRNLRIAAEHFGFACRVSYNQSNDSELPVALVRLSRDAGRPARVADAGSLFPAILKRRTNRNPFLYARIPNRVVSALQSAAEGSLVSVRLSTDAGVNQQVADLVAEAHRIQQGDVQFRKEIAEWVRPNFTKKGDGIPGVSLGLGNVASAVGPLAMRMFDMGKSAATRDQILCREAPLLVVLYGEDTVPQWLEVGELLQRLLLTVTREGLNSSFFNMPIEVPALRSVLRGILGINSWPQLLLRVGYCLKEMPPTPRRPLEEVMVTDNESIH